LRYIQRKIPNLLPKYKIKRKIYITKHANKLSTGINNKLLHTRA